MQLNQRSQVKLALYLNYFVYAILLNSVGIVILMSKNNYGIDEVQASTLELFKDFSIAIVSFFLAPYLPKIGYKKAMLAALLLAFFSGIIMYFGNAFWAARLLFAIVGATFGVIKVSVYSLIGEITENEHQHNSLMSSIEGVFMIGIALTYFIFPVFIVENNPHAWLNVYWLLSGIIGFVIILVLNLKFGIVQDTNKIQIWKEFGSMFQLLSKLMIIVFVISAFFFVMIEQGIMTWLPTFNKEVIHLSDKISIMMASILALTLGVGRITAGVLTRRLSWYSVVTVSILIAMLLVVFILPKVAQLPEIHVNTFKDIPIIAFIFPIIGFFIAPIYPLLNSVILSALPKNLHSHMTGLIVIFSALGGTLGSRITGWLFKNFAPSKAFYFTLLPMFGLLLAFYFLKRLTKKNSH